MSIFESTILVLNLLILILLVLSYQLISAVIGFLGSPIGYIFLAFLLLMILGLGIRNFMKYEFRKQTKLNVMSRILLWIPVFNIVIIGLFILGILVSNWT